LYFFVLKTREYTIKSGALNDDDDDDDDPNGKGIGQHVDLPLQQQ